MRLYDDLIIDGDGTQGFRFAGDISEYVTGRCIYKFGSAKVIFAGHVEATGTGYLATAGSSIFDDTAVLTGDLVVSENARVDLCGMVVGSLENSGILSIAENTPESTVVTASLLPLLGDGDIDSRNTASAGDQDSQVLVGAVANATATQSERVQRSLFSFDLAEIPNDAAINAVSLTLQFDGNDPSSANNISGDLELYSMTEVPVFRRVNFGKCGLEPPRSRQFDPMGDNGRNIGSARCQRRQCKTSKSAYDYCWSSDYVEFASRR